MRVTLATDETGLTVPLSEVGVRHVSERRGEPHTVVTHCRQSQAVDVLLWDDRQLPARCRHGPAGGRPASHHLVQQGGRVVAVDQSRPRSRVAGQRGAAVGVLPGEVAATRLWRVVGGVAVGGTGDWVTLVLT